MTRLVVSLAAAFSLVVLTPARAGAQALAAGQPPPAGGDGNPAPPAASHWYDDITLNGLFSVSFVSNFNRPVSRTNQFRAFDTDESSFAVDVAELVVQRPVSRPGEAGFRVDVTVGRSVSRVVASPGLFRDDNGDTGDLDMHQVFFSYIAPVGAGLRFDAGKFLTPLGYEVIDGYDGFNENVSRSFLFSYAEPTTHTGVRVTYAPAEQVELQLLLVNGWDVAKDNNRGKSVGAQLSLTPWPRLSTYFNYMVGPEQDRSSNLRHVFTAVVAGKVTTRLTLTGYLNAGRESQVELEETAGGGTSDIAWKGVAGYARFEATDRVAATVRAEWFDDPQGALTGYVQTLREITFTPEVKLGSHVVIRGDVRRDRSDRDVFELSDGTFGRSQLTAGINALFVF